MVKSDDKTILVDDESEIDRSTMSDCEMETSLGSPVNSSSNKSDNNSKRSANKSEPSNAPAKQSDVDNIRSVAPREGEDPLTSINPTNILSEKETNAIPDPEHKSPELVLKVNNTEVVNSPKSKQKTRVPSMLPASHGETKVVVLKQAHPSRNSHDPQPNERIDEILESTHRAKSSVEQDQRRTPHQSPSQLHQHFRVCSDTVHLTPGIEYTTPTSSLRWMAGLSCLAFPPLGVFVALLVWRMHRRMSLVTEEFDPEIKENLERMQKVDQILVERLILSAMLLGAVFYITIITIADKYIKFL